MDFAVLLNIQYFAKTYNFWAVFDTRFISMLVSTFTK